MFNRLLVACMATLVAFSAFNTSHAANIRTGPDGSWSDGFVPFFLDQDLSFGQRADFLYNARYVELMTSVVFAEQDNGGFGTMTVVGGDEGVDSGFYAIIPDILRINGLTRGSVLHEIGHGLGLMHEHQRRDRNLSVTVNLSNVLPFKKSNFYRATATAPVTPVGPFDFGSLMIYSSCSFVKPGRLGACLAGDTTMATLIANDGTVIVPQRDRFSRTDLLGLHTLYAPDAVLPAADITVTGANESALCQDGDVIVDGDLILDGTTDIDADCVIRVLGDVVVSPSFAGQAIRLSGLKSVAGDVLMVGMNTIERLSFPVLGIAEGVRIENTPLLTSVNIANLEMVLGQLTLVGTQVVELNIDRLVELGELLINSNAALEFAFMGALERVRRSPLVNLSEAGSNESFVVTNNPVLRSVSAAALVSVETIDISRNIDASKVDLPALVTATSVSITDSSKVTDVMLSSLGRHAASLGRVIPSSLVIADLDALQLLDLQALEAAGTATLANNGGADGHWSCFLPSLIEVGLLAIRDNGGLTSFSAPVWSAEANWVNIDDNPILFSVFAPQLTHVLRDMSIMGNFLLAELDLSSLESVRDITVSENGLPKLTFDALTTVDALITIESNGAMTDVSFPVLRSADSVGVSSNATLETISLGELFGDTTDVIVLSNPMLRSVNGLGTELRHLFVGRNGDGYTSTLTDNLQIRLGALTRLHGDLRVHSNSSMHVFRGLNPTLEGGLQQVDGDFRIVNNGANSVGSGNALLQQIVVGGTSVVR